MTTEDITSPVPIAVTTTPTMVPVSSTTPDSVATSPITPEASFHLPFDDLATSSPTNVPTASTDSTPNSGGNSASISPIAPSSSLSAPQSTFPDTMSGVTSSSGEITSTYPSVSINEASSSSDGQEIPTTSSTAISSSGSSSEASIGDTSTNGSIEFGSSSIEIPNEIGSDAGSQAIGSIANSGTQVVAGVMCMLQVLVMFIDFY